MACRRLLGGLILSLALSYSFAAEPPTTAIIGTPPQPGWGQLNGQQKNILAPLAKDWDGMENIRKKKWLGIAERFPTMKQDEQQRMQDRMREWADLSPTERSKVRDTYKDFKQLPPEQKQVIKQKWEAYSNLPPDEKQRIRETGKSSKLLATPSASAAVSSSNVTHATDAASGSGASAQPSVPGGTSQ
ncbi:MAG: hypothetical protein H6R13_3913 [Proteobacteria bacterium]|nr:hypothetical protein [Pseudomonadota bacterium]